MQKGRNLPMKIKIDLDIRKEVEKQRALDTKWKINVFIVLTDNYEAGRLSPAVNKIYKILITMCTFWSVKPKNNM